MWRQSNFSPQTHTVRPWRCVAAAKGSARPTQRIGWDYDPVNEVEMESFIVQHHEALAVLAFFSISSAVTTMPKTWTGVGTAWNWFYDWSHELVGMLSQKYAAQIQALQGVVPPSATPAQIADEKAGTIPSAATFPVSK
jgi:hypothetical protein